jgi:hypothetical protein
MPVLLDLLTEEVGHLRRSAPLEWKNYTPTTHDMNELEQNSAANNTFDKDSLKHKVWMEYKNGKYKCIGKTCELGQIVALLPPGHEIPLDDWGRIFQWFGKAASGGPWVVYWFGSPVKRLFPNPGEELGPGHVNGGYTIPCSTKGIFIYRLEEATRVLIHELMHAACLDPPSSHIPERESHVETWAEILLIAFRSKGSLKEAERLWKAQADWVVSTNQRAAKSHGVNDDTDYAWRYLNGRIAVYRELGFELPAIGKSNGPANSTRFTHPRLE